MEWNGYNHTSSACQEFPHDLLHIATVMRPADCNHWHMQFSICHILAPLKYTLVRMNRNRNVTTHLYSSTFPVQCCCWLCTLRTPGLLLSKTVAQSLFFKLLAQKFGISFLQTTTAVGRLVEESQIGKTGENIHAFTYANFAF